jgi:hypothetical protein
MTKLIISGTAYIFALWLWQYITNKWVDNMKILKFPYRLSIYCPILFPIIYILLWRSNGYLQYIAGICTGALYTMIVGIMHNKIEEIEKKEKNAGKKAYIIDEKIKDDFDKMLWANGWTLNVEKD